MLAMLAAVLLATAPQYDTVFTTDGGRLVGTVVEEGPQGVAIQLPDGTTRRLQRREVSRIEYADGSVSTAGQPAAPAPPAYKPPPPPPSAPPPPSYRPPYPPPRREPGPAYAGRRGEMAPILPIYGSFGIGGAFLSGKVESGVSVDRVFDPQLDIWLEGGLRLVPELSLGLYADIGVGDPAREIRDVCDASFTTCTATTGRIGVLLRHSFRPRALSTPWVAIGTGFEFGSVTADDGFGGSSELFSYSGWEALRLMAGIDLRSNPVFGVGFYGGVAFGTYTHFEDAAGTVDLGRQPFHTTVQAGLRFTLFP